MTKTSSPYSDLKIFHHIDHIKGMEMGKRISPIYIRIKPTNVCNQRCYFCAYADDSLFEGRTVNRDSIPWNVIANVLNDFKEMGGKAVTYSGGGEPLCYKYIINTLKLTKELGIDLSMITNGQALEGECVDYLKDAKWIRVSFDAATDATYHSIRNVNTHSRVVKNIENFAKVKSSNCVLGINCVVSETNADELYEICNLLKNIGVNNIKLSPVLIKGNTGEYHKRIKDITAEQISRAKSVLEDNSFRIVDKYSNDYALSEEYEKPYHRCYIQEYFAVVAADSKVYRCHQRAYTEAGVLGDLSQKTFKDLWSSDEVIKKVREFDPCIECNFRCAFDERNNLLNDFFSLDENHINFV